MSQTGFTASAGQRRHDGLDGLQTGEGGVEFMRIGKPKAFSTPGRSYAVALPFICCGQFAGRLSPSVIKFGSDLLYSINYFCRSAPHGLLPVTSEMPGLFAVLQTLLLHITTSINIALPVSTAYHSALPELPSSSGELLRAFRSGLG